ncbi:helix-turn-helix domain-containing protein [Streptomyces boluensis]|uniref:Helix-turn-helix domain-containing protein n=1 Tax=Streptomyces boluensis TaxID=1775135 RepID=A0A964XPB2_9ACTN|nr:helix-turn-helix domain-containing protein [Streptomyces boluensis]NBE56365.1 helix-turn-helix domain-containing protein [Streptomyces boluensis]
MAAPRRDAKGIVDATELFSRVRFRRREPAEPLRPYLEHYWLIDWDLPEPYLTHVVPHPSVNVVFQHSGTGDSGEVAGIGLELFAQKLEGAGRVCGVQFRPGGFRPFAAAHPVSEWTGRRLALDAVFPATAVEGTAARVLEPDDEHARVAALDAFLLSLAPAPDPQADLAMSLVERVRSDRSVRRVGELARTEGLSTRSLQRLFSAYVGVGPKWVILRYRIHEALERAESDAAVDWPALAADLGYADQAHLIRDFTATVGVPPTAYGSGNGGGGSKGVG